MQFSLSPPSPSPLPLAGTTIGSATGLQSPENYAEPGAEQGGLFAQILSQLDLQQPITIAPVGAGSAPVIAQLTAQIAADDLPPTGKTLPPVLPQTGDEALPQLTAVEVAEPGDVLAPLPVVPHPLQQPRSPQPAVVTTTRASTPKSTPTPSLTAEPLAQPSVVAVRDAVIEPATLRSEVATADKLLAVQTPQDFVTIKQTVIAPNPTVAPSPSLNPAPAPPAAPTPTTPPQHAYTLNQPVADPQWGKELGQRLIWMNGQGIGRAELRMNPPELGPVEVRIAVSNDDARVVFQVQHGATREALESAMPRLREMFAAQGLNLTDASVSDHSAQGQQQTGQSGGGAAGNNAEGALGQPDGQLTDAPDYVRATPLDGSIDTYV